MRWTKGSIHHSVTLAAACLIAAPTAILAADTANERLTKVVRAGDVVTVTVKSGGRKKQAQVVDLNSCVLTVRSGGRHIELPLADVKTVRKHAPRKINPGASVVLDMADDCDQIGCAPAALAFVGIAAAVQGIANLAHPPKVAYRASKDDAPSSDCLR